MWNVSFALSEIALKATKCVFSLPFDCRAAMVKAGPAAEPCGS